MRILICHGYLLKGTGSNQYVQSMARALCREGHHLVIMCQEDDPDLDFVSVFLRGAEGGENPEIVWERETAYPGSCMVFRPWIGTLLPVYVYDSYAGFEVKEFTDLDDRELSDYIDCNRTAVARLVEQFAPAGIQVNHAVMLPCIVRPVAESAGVPYVVSVHGSDIEFTIRKDTRYLEFGIEGLSGAASVIVPSSHSADVTREVFGGKVDGLESLIKVIPPGVDTELFKPPTESLRDSVHELVARVAARTRGVSVGDFRAPDPEAEGPDHADDAIARQIERINAVHPEWLPEEDLAEKLGELADEGGPFIMFLGKLLETKGMHCVLPALPLILRKYPDLKLVVVGFGEFRGMLQLMLEAIASADARRMRVLCEYGERTYTRIPVSSAPVVEFLDRMEETGGLESYLRACTETGVEEAVIFTGYLTPEEHSLILGHASTLLVPSLAPEAFGLVATEAMACGVPPIASMHSGLKTAMQPIVDIEGRECLYLLNPDAGMIERIVEACVMVLDMTKQTRLELGASLRRIVTESFSWQAFAGRLVSFFGESAVD